ncbi:EAL domain-containing protein [Leptolyngbya sp. BC1307]|uniref:sensor domain-containing phosphodiesterase n=1 Tax=Leptolyngbya sp. BC1307 TaxID=2029589 RepID=UPI000EFA997A|nr:EAL domain-containing protein [Leptolyngbya sp. BC1307]
MRVASWPAKETLRLAKLQDYNILDTSAEPAYDDIAALAAHVCGTPAAFVSLIDANRQWFKAKVGADVNETPRSVAFCAHTIQQMGVMIVEDAQQDPRFCQNPLVTGPPYIRFYAGAPLATPDGHHLGSLCVVDYQPRQLTVHQLSTLQVLSRQIMAQMELARHAHQLKLSNERLEQRVKARTSVLTSALHLLLKNQTKLLKREAALRHSSLHDPLTGLPNRSYFLERLYQAIQLAHRQPDHLYAVWFIDLDNFKPVNDVLGHGVGDQLLKQVAAQIKKILRRRDLVARLGGDEFAVLLDDIPNEAHAITAVKRLQEQLQQPFLIEGQKVFISASIGITFSHSGYYQPEAALRDADTAMYQAKKRTKQRLSRRAFQNQQPADALSSPIIIQDEGPLGGQSYALFNPTMPGRAKDRVTLENDLRQALLSHQFHLYYQPIFDMGTRQISGLAVRLCWHHPTQGCLEAEEFMAAAEEIGIVRPLCEQVIHTACQQLKQWRQLPAGSNLRVHLSLSVLEMTSPQMVSHWQDSLRAAQLSASAFQLEFNESVLVNSDPITTAVLQQLKALSVGLCVNDFARGNSSLSRLHQLAVDTLKIDREFVKELDLGQSSSMVKTIVCLGRSANMTVIAEGVETETQMQTLIALGCRLGQGPWLSEALPAIAIDHLLSVPDAGDS